MNEFNAGMIWGAVCAIIGAIIGAFIIGAFI